MKTFTVHNLSLQFDSYSDDGTPTEEVAQNFINTLNSQMPAMFPASSPVILCVEVIPGQVDIDVE